MDWGYVVIKYGIIMDTHLISLMSALNRRFITEEGMDWGYVVIKYGIIMAMPRVREPFQLMLIQMRYSRFNS